VSDHIPDATNMISDTPISDSTAHNVGDLGMLCRRLERKLAATRKYLSEVSERAKRLEEAGNMLEHNNGAMAQQAWRKAKEAKP